MTDKIIETRNNQEKFLFKFELAKGLLRFFLIFAIYWTFHSTINLEGKNFIATNLPKLLVGINLLYVLLLLTFKERLIQNIVYLKAFHYLSLILCPLVFSLAIKYTGGENSVFVGFFYFYLVVIPLAQINFSTIETIFSEILIILSYPILLNALTE